MEKFFAPYFINQEEETYLEEMKTKSNEIQNIYSLTHLSMGDLIEINEKKINKHYQELEELRAYVLSNYTQEEYLLRIIEKQLNKVQLINNRKKQNNSIGVSYVNQWIKDYQEKYILPLDIRDILECDYFYAMELMFKDILKNIERLEEYKNLIENNNDKVVQKIISVINNMIDNYKFVLSKKINQ